MAVRMRFERPVSPPPCKNNTLFILSSNQIFAAVFSQHRFHLIQAFDSGAHLHLITRACCFDVTVRSPRSAGVRYDQILSS